MAAYPVEDHGFVEPSSWTDEYKRILKLFEEHLKKEEAPLKSAPISVLFTAHLLFNVNRGSILIVIVAGEYYPTHRFRITNTLIKKIFL